MLHPFKPWVIEDALDDLGAHTLPLIRPVDNHIPDGCSIDKVGEDSAKPDQTISIPGTEREIGMAKHFLRVTEGSILSPWSLMEQLKELRWIRRLVMGVGNSGLEGWRHLVLEYPPELN